MTSEGQGESKAANDAAKTTTAHGTGLVYGIEDKPPFMAALLAALQHLLAIFVAIITPPLLIAGGLHIEDPKIKGFLVEKAFQGGRDKIAARLPGVPVESLAIVTALGDGKIELA